MRFEQYIIPGTEEYQPLENGDLIDRIDHNLSAMQEIDGNLEIETDLDHENRQELYKSFTELSTETERLLETAEQRGLIGQSLIEEVIYE